MIGPGSDGRLLAKTVLPRSRGTARAMDSCGPRTVSEVASRTKRTTLPIGNSEVVLDLVAETFSIHLFCPYRDAISKRPTRVVAKARRQVTQREVAALPVANVGRVSVLPFRIAPGGCARA